MVERQGAVEVEHGHQAPVEAAFLDGDGGAPLRLGRVRVERPPVDALHRGDGVGAHALVRLRVDLLEVRVVGAHRQEALLGQRHHLGAAADDEVLVTGHHHRRGEVVGRDARAAEAVEGHAAGAHVVAGVERGHAAEVAALLAHLRAGAPDDVVDVGGVEAVALDERPQHGCREVLRVQVRERALALLADAARRAARVDDESVGHGGSSVSCEHRWSWRAGGGSGIRTHGRVVSPLHAFQACRFGRSRTPPRLALREPPRPRRWRPGDLRHTAGSAGVLPPAGLDSGPGLQQDPAPPPRGKPGAGSGKRRQGRPPPPPVGSRGPWPTSPSIGATGRAGSPS